jgi:hypothetical protein
MNGHRPPLPPPDPAARRKAFRVDANTPVYLCVQNLRKFHPDFDDVLGVLLARDPRGRVVLVADEQPGITDTLMSRLRDSLGPDVRRVGVVPRQERAGYLRLVSCADVFLDTPHYGSGANTVADAVACRTPLVTARAVPPRPMDGRRPHPRWAGRTGRYLHRAVRRSCDSHRARRTLPEERGGTAPGIRRELVR